MELVRYDILVWNEGVDGYWKVGLVSMVGIMGSGWIHIMRSIIAQ